MKIIHCADVHLGSCINSRFDLSISNQIKQDVRSAFNKMLEWAQSHAVHVVLLSGDIFDSSRPLKRDKEFFFNAIKANNNIDFLYLKGNHDLLSSYDEILPNLKTFSDCLQKYSYDNIDIYGIELNDNNRQTFYNDINFQKDRINILMLHGDINNKNDIDLSRLENKNIDYLALGHLHSFSTGKLGRGIFCYSGCLQGRGFDETGKKGYIYLDISDKIAVKRVINNIKFIDSVTIDISSCKNSYDAYLLVKDSLDYEKNSILRVILTGEVDFDNALLDEEIKNYLLGKFAYLEVKNNTEKIIDTNAFKGDKTIKGEFFNIVSGDENLSPKQKNAILNLGLKALEGRDL